jgi:hypothetical protein
MDSSEVTGAGADQRVHTFSLRVQRTAACVD